MSHYRNAYKNRFVSASSGSSGTSSISGSGGGFSYGSSAGSGDMSAVPPPPVVGGPAAHPAFSNAKLAARERDKQKEEEFMNLMAYGTKKDKGPRKTKMYDDDYLEGDDSDEEQPKSSKSEKKKEEKKAEPVADEDDELDAFMAEINQQANKDKEDAEKKEKERLAGKEKEDKKKGMGRADIDDPDMQESFFEYLKDKKEREEEEEEEYEYDADGNIIYSWKKVIDPLPPIDHTTIQYPSFTKDFYEEHSDIQNLTYQQAQELRQSLNIRVGGHSVPKPVCSFGHFGFDKVLMESIVRCEYEKPTPIQAQAIPAALSGRDVLGIAKTGSGKTAAYLWPAIEHVIDQPSLNPGEGPIAVIVVPTRELAIQVYQEAKRFCKPYNLNVICAYGGGSKWEQSNELRDEGAEVVVCTPGRIIDLVKIGATNFLRTSFLVFDEADRMFDMGFEAQVKSISDHIRPDRQCLMFSATFKQKVERLARDALQDPVRIVQGEVGEANADVKQIVEVLYIPDIKYHWLTQRLVEFESAGKVLIFVTKKVRAEDLAHKLKVRDFKLVLLHGDMLQHERTEHLQAFRKGVNIMVATDVAARGLDIPEIRTVINYDLAKDIDTHVHRIGRTGRAGHQGTAYTLVSGEDAEMAGHLVRNLESVNQEVSEDLMKLAMKSAWFRNRRQGGGGGSFAGGPARMGLGYQPKTKPIGGTKGDVNLDPLKEQSRPSTVTTSSIAKAATAAAVASGPGNRMTAMKSAFQKSFASTFQRSTEQSVEASRVQPTDPRPEWRRKIDEINAKIAADQAAPKEGGGGGAPEKKRSRWQ